MMSFTAILLDDALFAAVAAVGFSTISNTPKRAYFICALAAAVAHSLRSILLHADVGLAGNLIVASLLAAFVAGLIAVVCSPMIKVPAESCLFPALLPMIPGMYAYKAVAAFARCLMMSHADEAGESLYLLGYNGLICLAVVAALVIGGVAPVFMLKRISYRATR